MLLEQTYWLILCIFVCFYLMPIASDNYFFGAKLLLKTEWFFGFSIENKVCLTC